jgi:hypothetical protein
MFLVVAVAFFLLAVLFVRACTVIAEREGSNEDHR